MLPKLPEAAGVPEARAAGYYQQGHHGGHGQRPPCGGAALAGAQVLVFEALPQLAGWWGGVVLQTSAEQLVEAVGSGGTFSGGRGLGRWLGDGVQRVAGLEAGPEVGSRRGSVAVELLPE
jgi:hypothetical protein